MRTVAAVTPTRRLVAVAAALLAISGCSVTTPPTSGPGGPTTAARSAGSVPAVPGSNAGVSGPATSGAATSAASPPGPGRPGSTGPGVVPGSGGLVAPGSALANLPDGTPPTGVGIRDAIAAALTEPDLRGRIGVAVLDPRTGQLLYGFAPRVRFLPASTQKLFTATAAIDALGAGRRFTTRVVRTSASGAPISLALVGGGDISLARAPVAPAAPGKPPAVTPVPGAADIATLAARTVAALSGVRSLRISVDASLFTGPRVSPAWIASYLISGEVSPVSPLTVDAGRVGPGRRQRSAVPEQAAAQAFVAALAARGVHATIDPAPVRAPTSAPVVAAVDSPPVAALIAHMLAASDNDYAESLLRHIALASRLPATFAGGTRAVRADLVRRGVDPAAVLLADGSGLSRADRATPAAIATVLTAALRDPRLRPVADGLAVAGVSGTLRDGFTGPAASGRGRVHAKSGTLAGVSALAGTIATASAGELVFVLLTDSLPTNLPWRARRALELAAARLAQCGCHNTAPGPRLPAGPLPTGPVPAPTPLVPLTALMAPTALVSAASGADQSTR